MILSLSLPIENIRNFATGIVVVDTVFLANLLWRFALDRISELPEARIGVVFVLEHRPDHS